jgi:hypothetical protein
VIKKLPGNFTHSKVYNLFEVLFVLELLLKKGDPKHIFKFTFKLTHNACDH